MPGKRSTAIDLVKPEGCARAPAVPVLSSEKVIEHPHLAARAAFPEVPHPARERVRVTATPFQADA